MKFLESVSCDICGGRESIEVIAQKDLAFLKSDERFQVVECLNCHLRYTNPRPVKEYIGQFYLDEYYDLHSPLKVRKINRKWRSRIKKILKEEFYHYPRGSEEKESILISILKRAVLRIEQFRLKVAGREKGIIPFIGNGRVLDVGCGNGAILNGLKSEGWKTYGVELNQKAAEYAKVQLNLDVFPGTLLEAKYPDSFFDVILFNHTLEHMYSPKEILRETSRILSQGGLLIISLPNLASVEAKLFKSFWFPWELPRHLYHFSPETLSQVLKLNGFKITKISGDMGLGTFMQSLEYVYRFKFKKSLSHIKAIRKLVRPFLFVLGHCALSGIITVYATKNGCIR